MTFSEFLNNNKLSPILNQPYIIATIISSVVFILADLFCCQRLKLKLSKLFWATNFAKENRFLQWLKLKMQCKCLYCRAERQEAAMGELAIVENNCNILKCPSDTANVGQERHVIEELKDKYGVVDGTPYVTVKIYPTGYVNISNYYDVMDKDTLEVLCYRITKSITSIEA